MRKTLIFSLTIFFLFSFQLLFSQADAGPDQEICADHTYMEAVNPAPSSGYWTILTGTGSFSDPTSSNTYVSDIAMGTNIFRWQVGGSFDDVLITNNSVTAAAGSDATICADNTFLNASDPFVIYPYQGTGGWTNLSGNGAIIVNSLLPNTQVTGLQNGTNTFRWTVTNGTCSIFDDVVINNRTVNATATDAQTCDGNIILTGNNPAPGENGVWTTYTGTVTFDNNTLHNTGVHNLAEGNNTFVWTINNGDCYDDANINISYVNPVANAGPDQDICADFTYMGANNPAPGNGIWSVITGSGTFTNLSNNGTYVSGIGQGTNAYRWTVTESGCVNFDDVTINNNLPYVNAGPNQLTCVDNITLSGNTPGENESGVWTQTGGIIASITDNTLQNTTVTGMSNGTAIFTWTVSNAFCNAEDQVIITFNDVVAVVGDSISVCGTTAYLNGNEPQAGENGVWTVTAGTGIISNTAIYNTQVINLNKGENKFRWTISNGSCSDYADLVVTNNLYDATASVAGPTVICTDSADLLGNIPVQGSTGMWSIWAGGGSFDDPTSPTARIHNLLRGDNTLRWTITKNGCSNYDDVVITNNMVEAFAGVDQITCGTDANLVANGLYPGLIGIWTLVSGSGTILTPTSNETVVTGQGTGVNVFRWTVSGNGCMNQDEVHISENSFVTSAGFNKDVCDTTATLQAQDPSPGTGIWSFSGPGVTIVTPTSNTTDVNGLHENSTHTFRWTVYKNGCSAWDDVIITNNLVYAHAGDDQFVCNSQATLSAENPIAGTGAWSITLGAGTLADQTYYGTTITGLIKGTNTLTWTVTNLTCTDADNIVITNNVVLATAGADQAICQNTANLSGDQPQNGGYGVWETIGGSGVVQNTTAFNSAVTNLQRGVNTFRWTVYENGCDNGGELVQIVNNDFDAYAGEDQILPPLTTATNFTATLPVNGIGQWSILSGSGNIANLTNQTSYIDNIYTGVNQFIWTVSKTNGCYDSDDVSILVPKIVYPGLGQIVCSDTAKLNARSELGASSQTWSIVSGGGTFDDIHDPKTIVRNINQGSNVYRWTVNFVGYSAYDDVIITNDSIFVDAGDDIEVCADSAFLGNTGLGEWNLLTGCGTIVENTADYTVIITDLCQGENELELTVTNGNCTSRDTVAITYNLPPIAGFETDPTTFCAPDSVTIINTSDYYPGNTEPDEFRWRVEGNYIGTTFDVNDDITHYFTNTGTTDSIYTVSLVAIDYETQCTDTITSQVTAYAIPYVDFQISGSHVRRIPDAIFTIENRSATDLDSYYWDFGNGNHRLDYEFVGSFEYEYLSEGTYGISLLGINSSQCDAMFTDTVVVLPYTSVDEINSNFKVFPNPTDGLINISSTSDLSDAVFELKNITGQEVQYKLEEQTAHSCGIDISNLAKGLYFLKINLKGETKILRLVKK